MRPDRLADIAHGKLEELIVTLELAPGSPWSEAMLSERIGIGRTPVREAVQRLAWERLVTIIRRHGVQKRVTTEQPEFIPAFTMTDRQ